MMNATDAKSLIEAEHTRRKLIEQNDLDALEAMTADHFHYAHITGFVESREEYFARLRSGDGSTRIFRTSASDLNVEMRGGYALLSGKSMIDAVPGLFNTLFLSVWEPGSDGWKIAAYASTPLPETNQD